MLCTLIRRGRTWLAALQVHPRWGPGARASSLDPPRQGIRGPASLLVAGSRNCTPAGVSACRAGPLSKRCPYWETLAVALGLRGSLCRRIRVAISGKHLVISSASVMILICLRVLSSCNIATTCIKPIDVSVQHLLHKPSFLAAPKGSQASWQHPKVPATPRTYCSKTCDKRQADPLHEETNMDP